MKIALVELAALLFLAPAMSAQSSDPPREQTVRCIDKQPNCDTKYRDGVEQKTLFANSVVLITSVLQEDGHLVVHMLIANEKDAPARIEIAPENVHLLRLRTNEAPLEIKRREAAKIAKSSERRQRFASALAAGSASLATNTATVQSSDGTTSTVQIPNTSAQDRAQTQAAINNRAAHDYGTLLITKELKRNTLDPGQDTMGRVYFDQKIATGAYVVRVDVSGIAYETPFLVMKK